MKTILLPAGFIPVLLLAILSSPALSQTSLTFKKVNLTSQFVGEGVTVGDFNKDGKLDVAAGSVYWLGPGFTQKIKYGDGTETFDGSKGYAAYYMNLPAMDLNGDGWTDIPVSAGVGGQDFWLENPKGGTGVWKKTTMVPYAGFESNNLWPLLKNGSLQLLYATQDKKIGYGTPDPSDPTKPWIFHAIGNPSPAGGSYNGYILNSHGLGMGDINGDGRNDVMASDAWFEQPASLAGDPLWIRHDFDFHQKKGIASTYTTNGAWGGSHMYADDVDADGDADVVASLDGHGWGLAWFEQVKENNAITFKAHPIMGNRAQEATFGVAFSQLHSLAFADMNGDGLKDIVTGKRYWAHNTTGDPEPMGQAVLYAFLQQRGAGAGSTTFKPVLIDTAAGSGCRLELVDMNGDGYQDVAVSSKKGTNVFLSEGRPSLPVVPRERPAGRVAGGWTPWIAFPGGIPAPGAIPAGAGASARIVNLLGSTVPAVSVRVGYHLRRDMPAHDADRPAP